MKLYILCPEGDGDGIYYLLTEEGEGLASHLCSNAGFAKGDLILHRPERIKEFTERFGSIEVFYADSDKKKELIEKNKQLYINENKDKT